MNEVKNVELEEIIGVYKRQHQEKVCSRYTIKKWRCFLFENYSYLDLGNSKLDEFLKVIKHYLNYKEPIKESLSSQAETSIVYELEKLDQLRSKVLLMKKIYKSKK